MKVLEFEVTYMKSMLVLVCDMVDVETPCRGRLMFHMDFNSGEFVLSSCGKMKRMSSKERYNLFIELAKHEPKKDFKIETWYYFVDNVRLWSGAHTCPMCNAFIHASKKHCSDNCRVKAYRTREKTEKGQLSLDGVGGGKA